MSNEYIFILIIVIIFIFLYLKPKSTKRKSNFWIYQPIMNKEIAPNEIENEELEIIQEKPKIINKAGFIFKEAHNHTDILEKLNKNTQFHIQNYSHYSDISKSRMFYVEKLGIPVAIIYAIPTTYMNNMIYYVTGLYVSPKFRNNNLASMCITNLIDNCWKDTKRYFFIHDNKILSDSIIPYFSWDITSFIYHPLLSYFNNSVDDFTDLCKLPKLETKFDKSFNSMHTNNQEYKTEDNNTIIIRKDNYWCNIIESSAMITHKDMVYLCRNTGCYIYQSPNIYIQRILPSLFRKTEKRILYLYNVKFVQPKSIPKPLDTL
jgi:hypothetical protein